MDWVGLELDSIRLDGLDWNELGWIGLDWIGECGFCTPLYTFSVLTYALTGKEKTSDKTQLSASFPWGVQN